MTIRATIDANVVASGVAGTASRLTPPMLILDAWRLERFVMVFSEHLVGEVATTLTKRYFRTRVPEDRVGLFLAELRAGSLMLDPTPYYQPITRDPADNLVLATALAGSADYLVTGDAELLALVRHETVSIVTAAQFVQALEL